MSTTQCTPVTGQSEATSPALARQPRRRKDSDRIGGKEFAEIIAVVYPGTFNRARRALEEFWSKEQHTWLPLPNDRQLRATIYLTTVVVCRPLGGIHWPKTDWSYSRQDAQAIRDRGPQALGEILSRRIQPVESRS